MSVIDLTKRIREKERKKFLADQAVFIQKAEQSGLAIKFVFPVIRGIKNNTLPKKEVMALSRFLIQKFSIQEKEIENDDLLDLEFNDHTPQKRHILSYRQSVDMLGALKAAAQMGFVPRTLIIRFIKVARKWNGIG